MKNTVFLLLLSLSIIPACKKNGLPAANGNTLNKTVATIPGTSPSQTIDSFVYDGQQRLAEVITAGTNPTFSDTITFQYNGSGQVQSWTQINSNLGKLVTYELSYDGNGHILKAMAVPQLAGYSFSDFTFVYNTQGQLVTDSVYAQHVAGVPSPGILSYDNWTYDAHGNAIADQQFISSNANPIGAPFTATTSTQYQYDTQINPYYQVGIPLYSCNLGNVQLLSPNNLIGAKSGTTSAMPPDTYSYAYYNNGRPRIQSATISGSNGYTQTTAYFYQ